MSESSKQPSLSPQSDSARSFLESLAEDRGTRMLSEEEYQESRRLVLKELATGPRPRAFTLVTFGIIGLIVLGFLMVGLIMAFDRQARDWLLAVSSGGCLLMWAYILWQYLSGLRQQAQMSLQARLDEVEELRRNQLISQGEYEQIYAAILSSRLTQ